MHPTTPRRMAALPKARPQTLPTALAVAALSLFAAQAHAAPVELTITVTNTAPVNSVSFAPLHFGFGGGTFDAFNNGAAAGPAITSVAEGGSGSDWQPAFAASEPNATRGTVGMPLFPGQTRSLTLMVDGVMNPFFTFASMVIPSNDLFIGNDNPMGFRVFDAAGALILNQINQAVSQIWDNGSEVADPANAAFVVGGNNDLRTPQNGVVSFSASELGVFNGLTTGAGYVFSNAALAADTSVYRINFSLANTVPEPGSMGLAAAALLALGAFSRRRAVAA